MVRKKRFRSAALFFSGIAWAVPSAFAADQKAVATSETGEATVSTSLPSHYYLGLTLLSSKSGKENDFRTVKTIADDTGVVSENSVIPNINYFSGKAVATLAGVHRFTFAGLIAIDGDEDRSLLTAYGKWITMPGRILSLRYQYSLTPDLTLSAGQVHIDTTGFSDPTASAAYRIRGNSPFSGKVGSTLSAPVTTRSRTDHMITRASARALVGYKTGRWIFSSSLTHSRVFFDGPSPKFKGWLVPTNPAQSAGASGASSEKGIIEAAPSTPIPPMEAVDFALMERESNRTTAHFNSSVDLSQSVRIQSGAGLSLLQTTSHSQIWMSAFRPVSVSYTHENWELNSGLTFSSDLLVYTHPSIPNLWIVGVRLSYAIGERPGEI